MLGHPNNLDWEYHVFLQGFRGLSNNWEEYVFIVDWRLLLPWVFERMCEFTTNKFLVDDAIFVDFNISEFPRILEDLCDGLVLI